MHAQPCALWPPPPSSNTPSLPESHSNPPPLPPPPQSTKLSVFEARVLQTVNKTKHLPEQLALHGTVHISAKVVAQLIGQVFLQRSAVNLLSTVMDTPEWFWWVRCAGRCWWLRFAGE